MRPSELCAALEFLLPRGENVLIKGAPGHGKTSIVKQACARLGYDLIISHPAVADPTDYKGLPFADKEGKTAHFLPFGELNRLIEAQRPTVYFLDDLGQASEATQKGIMALILERRINGHTVSQHVTFVAATNRKEDFAGVSGILEPIKSRYSSILSLETCVDDWINWAFDNAVPSEVISFVRFKPQIFDGVKATRDIVNSPCPRTLAAAARMIAAGLPKALRFSVLSGAIGEEWGNELCAFLKLHDELPTVAEILSNPTGARISDDPAVCYAVSGALSAVVSEVTIEAAMVYLNRLPPEFLTLMMRDATVRNPAIAECRPYQKWMEQTFLQQVKA
jgi:hypothetical protein